MQFNLIYHIYAPQGNKTWMDNIDYLKRYIHIFNNKKIVNIATGEGLCSPEEIRKYFNDPTIQFIETPNDPKLGEVAGFKKLLERVYSLDPNEATFYAHAKGASHRKKRCPKTIRMWYECMYKYNLQNPKEIEDILTESACCGCFKYNKKWNEIAPWALPDIPFSDWHYSGTFFWFNNAKIFNKDWGYIAQNTHGTEAYLSKFFSREESFCIFLDIPKGLSYHTYSKLFWWVVVWPCQKFLFLQNTWIFRMPMKCCAFHYKIMPRRKPMQKLKKIFNALFRIEKA